MHKAISQRMYSFLTVHPYDRQLQPHSIQMHGMCSKNSGTVDDMPFDQLISVQEKLACFGIVYHPNEANASQVKVRTILKGVCPKPKLG